MKKLLGILFISFLLNGCATTDTTSSKGKVDKTYYEGMTKEEFKKNPKNGYSSCWNIGLHNIKDPLIIFGYGCTGHNLVLVDKYPEYNTEILHYEVLYSHRDGRMAYFVFENVTKFEIEREGRKLIGNGKLKLATKDLHEAKIAADLSYAKKVEDEKKEAEKRLAEEKKAAEEKRLAEEKKRKEEELKKLASKHKDKCLKKSSNQEGFEKDTPEFNNCLIVKEKERIRIEKEEAKRLKLEEEKLKNMKPQQRAEYKCINTFGFKKGTDNYNECLFKLYSVELELEKMKLEHEIQVQRLALEREKVKAAKAQTEAAKAQAEAAYRSALANEEQAYQQRRSNAQKSINRGMRMLSGACTLGVNC